MTVEKKEEETEEKKPAEEVEKSEKAEEVVKEEQEAETEEKKEEEKGEKEEKVATDGDEIKEITPETQEKTEGEKVRTPCSHIIKNLGLLLGTFFKFREALCWVVMRAFSCHSAEAFPNLHQAQENTRENSDNLYKNHWK